MAGECQGPLPQSGDLKHVRMQMHEQNLNDLLWYLKLRALEPLAGPAPVARSSATVPRQRQGTR